jgi:hypothetical protein
VCHGALTEAKTLEQQQTTMSEKSNTDYINNLAWLGTIQTLFLFVMVGAYALWHHRKGDGGHQRHKKMMRTLSNVLRDMSSPGHVIP